jgi:Integrase core domain
MSCTVSPSSGKSYGLALVCRAWRTPRATVYRHRAPPMTQPTQRRGPVGPMPDAALLAAIRAVLAASPFHGPEGNGCAERFIRTLKENLLWVQTFDTIEDLRHALLAFRETYNATWLIERHRFITPAAFRRKQLQPAALAA